MLLVISTFLDGVKNKEKEANLPIKDIAELIAEAEEL